MSTGNCTTTNKCIYDVEINNRNTSVEIHQLDNEDETNCNPNTATVSAKQEPCHFVIVKQEKFVIKDSSANRENNVISEIENLEEPNVTLSSRTHENWSNNENDSSTSSCNNIQQKCELDCNCQLLIMKEELDIKEEPLDSVVPNYAKLDLNFQLKTAEVPRTESTVQNECFICYHCNFKVSSKIEIARHLEIHKDRNPFKCSICNCNCFSKFELTNHLKTHARAKPYSCNFCDYKCSFKHILITHEKTHIGEKPFHCTVCNYRSSIKCNFIRHLTTHTDKKPLNCTICDYKSSLKYNLTAHLKTHTDERPFSCTICNCRFFGKSSLRSHLKTHTGEKPFICTMCDYKSCIKSNLKRHLRMHSKKNVFS